MESHCEGEGMGAESIEHLEAADTSHCENHWIEEVLRHPEAQSRRVAGLATGGVSPSDASGKSVSGNRGAKGVREGARG